MLPLGSTASVDDGSIVRFGLVVAVMGRFEKH